LFNHSDFENTVKQISKGRVRECPLYNVDDFLHDFVAQPVWLRRVIVFGALKGIRVIDLTSVGMGPYATQILGDMGADVIKVESPDGDAFRYIAPFRHSGMGAAFLNLNRNKRSIVLDLKNEKDKRVLFDLITTADVFISNVRPDSMRRLSLDYESVCDQNKRLIYCLTVGFSESGPYAGRPAFDDIVQAMSGLASLQGQTNSHGPKYVNTILADKVAGITAAWAIAMALYERELSGLGQSIEVPMFETMVSFTLIEHMAGETFCPPQKGMGYDRVLSPHRCPFQTRDGYISLLPYTTAQWCRFFEIAGKPEYKADARFTDPSLRSNNIDELYGIVSEIIAQRTTAEWFEALKGSDIPMAHVLSPQDLLQDRHLQSLDFFKHQQHPSEGEIKTIGIPVKFSRTPGAINRGAPQLDENRAEILEELNATLHERSEEELK
jgi:crotonobetainyl-CoA:carnitine CoA-transferase CaiB-like acyl-CoA transferase